MSEEKIREAVRETAEEIEKEKNKKPSDEEILLAETTVGEFTVRPWTLGKMLKINPCIERVFQKLEEKRIKLSTSNIEDSIVDLYFAAFPELVKIVSVSLEKDEDELLDLQLSDIIKLVFVIYKQNEESLKNVLSLLQPKLQTAQ